MTASNIAFDDIHLPDVRGAVAQDEEWFDVRVDGEQRRIRFHDYGAIYDVPGLYERLFYDELECRSPKMVAGLLGEQLEHAAADPADLVALDLGAGNGIVGEELHRMGVPTIVAVDLLPEAAAAAERDRPEVYDDYVVADLTRLTDSDRDRLAAPRFNCLTTVAALGFDDIPPQALATAYDLIEPGGWVALTIKEDFLTTEDPSGFQWLIRRMLDLGMLELRSERRYRHRLSTTGEPLYYIAMVASKRDRRSSATLLDAEG